MAAPKEKAKGQVKSRGYVGHVQLDHVPTTDILERIKEATPKKIVLLSVKITVAMALDMLTVNESNRHVRGEDVVRWARAMKDGKWMDAGDTIKFSRDGKMIDGQHRLLAIIESGMPQFYSIVTGLDPKAFNVIDTGRIRTASDAISIMGYKHTSILAAAIKGDIYYRKHGKTAMKHSQAQTPNYEVSEWLQSEVNAKLMNEVVEFSVSYLWKQGPFLARSSWAFIYYELSKKHRGDATQFIQALATGENISMTKNTAIHLVRQKLLALTIKKGKYEVQHSGTLFLKVLYIFTAWNLWRLGRNKQYKEITIDVNATELPSFNSLA